MKKKMLKPEMEFIKFNTEDVITTSGGGSGGDTFNFGSISSTVTTDNAHDSLGFSSGTNSLWNKPMQ